MFKGWYSEKFPLNWTLENILCTNTYTYIIHITKYLNEYKTDVRHSKDSKVCIMQFENKSQVVWDDVRDFFFRKMSHWWENLKLKELWVLIWLTSYCLHRVSFLVYMLLLLVFIFLKHSMEIKYPSVFCL